MADISYDEIVEDAGGPAVGARVKRMTNGLGAVLSVALILGLAVWGYRIAVRDARGVPVVRALEGPMRIAPDDPGGERMAHQGLAVNNVAAVGEVAAPADRLMLAPRPVELSDQDQAGYAPMPASAVVPTLIPTIPAPDALTEEGTSTGVLEGDAAAIDLEPEGVAVMAAPEPVPLAALVAPEAVAVVPLADVIVAPAPLGALPDPAVVADAVTLAVAEAVAEADPEPVIAGTAAAVAVSSRPMARPSREVSVEAAAVDAVAAPVASATLAPGTRLVQLGAYDDEAAATADWDRLNTQFAAYFDGKSPVIQKAESGGRVFYRLRALGFADEDAARRFCAVLLSESAACIPVMIR